MTDCYFDSSGCYVCPQLPAMPGTAPQVVVSPMLGWNAGADSVTQLAGDVSLTDTLTAAPVGIVLGLKTERTFNTDPTRILHGLYFYSALNQVYVQVVEQGVQIGQPQPYTLGTTFEIRRVGARVSYWLGGALLALRSALTTGIVLVNACLYSAGDMLP